MNTDDILYLAIVIAFFFVIDWLFGRVDERSVDSQR
jgi:hypothetical protein